MPRLPEGLGTPDQLGVVAPDPSRLIPHYDAGQVGAAVQGFASALGASANQIQDVQDRLSRAVAEQDFISKKLDLDQRFAGDTDYTTAPQRYRQAILQTLNDTSQGIAAPPQRADFQRQMSRVAAGGVDTIFGQSVAQARDAGRANVTLAGAAAVKDGLRATSDADIAQVINAYNDRVQASLEAGYLSPDEAVALRKGMARSYVSQRGWQLADADPQQAIDRLKPSGTDAEGGPVFEKVRDWPDLLEAGERLDMVQRAQQNLDAQQRVAGIEALRQQRQQQKAESDAAGAIAARYVSRLATDPTSVDAAALARERFPDSQQDTRQALLGAAQTAIAQAGGPASYGPGFWQAFNRVTAADGDPEKITPTATAHSPCRASSSSSAFWMRTTPLRAARKARWSGIFCARRTRRLPARRMSPIQRPRRGFRISSAPISPHSGTASSPARAPCSSSRPPAPTTSARSFLPSRLRPGSPSRISATKARRRKTSRSHQPRPNRIHITPLRRSLAPMRW